MENKPKFLLCIKYNSRVELLNKSLNAFELTSGNCSDCNARVMISGASAKLLKKDAAIKPLCQDCARNKIERDGKPTYTMTGGQLREAASLLQKLKAGNN
jgi:superfamily II helicase